MYTQHVILDFEMNPVAEFSSIKGLENEIIEIGAVKLNNNYEIIDRFDMYVRPQFNKSVTPYIRRLTGITQFDVYRQPYFEEALKAFSDWIGFEGNTRIYAWSNNDFRQIVTECTAKSLSLPSNMKRWLDFQAIYPRVMGISSGHNHMALHRAASHYGLQMDSKKAHNALYDAEITVELVIPVLTGDYKKQLEILNAAHSCSDEATYTLGDTCGGVLKELLEEMQLEIAV